LKRYEKSVGKREKRKETKYEKKKKGKKREFVSLEKKKKKPLPKGRAVVEKGKTLPNQRTREQTG